MNHLATTIQQYQEIIKFQIDQSNIQGVQNTLDDLESNFDIPTNYYNQHHGAIHLLTYLCQWDIYNANFLYERMNQQVQVQLPIPSLYKIVHLAMNFKYKSIIIAYKELIEYLKSQDKPEYLFFIQELEVTINLQVRKFLEKNYKTILMVDVEKYFQLNSVDTQIKIAQFKWVLNGEWVEITDQVESNESVREIENQHFDQITQLLGEIKGIL